MLLPPMDMTKRRPLNRKAARTMLAEYRSGRRDFRNLDLRQINLSWKELPGIDLSGCDLREAKLEGLKIPGAMLDGVNFDRATLYAATLAKAVIGNSQFDETILIEADLHLAKIRHSRFSATLATDADFTRTRAASRVWWKRDLTPLPMNSFSCST